MEAVDPNDREKSRLIFENRDESDEENCCAIFRLKIENVDRLFALKTPRFNETSMPWTLTVFKCSGALKVRLHSKDNESTKSVHVTLVSSVDGTNKNKCFQPTGNIQQQKLISWTELVKPTNGFIKTNSITIDVTITTDGINQLIAESKPAIKLECAICFEDIQDCNISSVACGHLFCTACIKAYVKEHGACPSCKKAAVEKDLRRTYLPM